MKSPEDLLSRLRQAGRVLITSHANPDGDAIGAELGLARLVRSWARARRSGTATRCRRSTARCRRPTASTSARSRRAASPTTSTPLVVLECPSLDRTGLEAQLAGMMPILNIDHHLGNQHYGAVNWVDVAAPAVGEMVLRLANDLKLEIDPDTAACLYLALVTDTGGFRFSNATPRAFEAAAFLVARGASPERTSQWLYESRPGGDAAAAGRDAGDARDLGRRPRSPPRCSRPRCSTRRRHPQRLRGAGRLPALDRRRRGGGAAARAGRGSRQGLAAQPRRRVDVERIARKHGGGGHRAAAGFEATGELAALRREVADELGRELPAMETA